MTWAYLLVAVGLLLANGFFVGAEFALIAARATRIEAMSREGAATANLALKSVREISLTLAGAQLGITMCSLGLGYVAEPAVADVIESGFGSFGDMPETLVHTISFVVALTIVTFFHMVIGEMAPKNIAIAEPERSALWVALPFRVFVNLFRPVLWVMNGMARAGCKLLGVEQQQERVAVATAEDIRAMAKESAEHGVIGEYEQRLLAGAASFGNRDAASVMVPRTEMVALPSTVTPAEIEGTVVATGHSRYPIYGENIDQVIGFVHAKDLLKVPLARRTKQLGRRWIRPMLVVPESLDVRPLLFSMRKDRRHFALVIDEHGGTSGIVTMEDLLEELVGEIRDEHDFAEAGIESLDEGRYVVPGTMRIDEASDYLDLRLPEGDYETVAGFVIERLGKIPAPGDSLEHDGWRLTVQTMRRRRIVRLQVERVSEGPGPSL